MSNKESVRDTREVNRTLQANERTLLEYLYTSLGLVGAGILFLFFLNVGWLWAVGITCIGGGIITSIIGVTPYRRMNKSICLIREQLGIDASRTTGRDCSSQM